MATITVSELALDLDTDARTARKFLRAITDADLQPGKGSRWAIEKRDIRSLKSKFAKFAAAAAQAKLDKEIAKNAAEVADDADDALMTAKEEFDMMISEPIDDELADIDAE